MHATPAATRHDRVSVLSLTPAADSPFYRTQVTTLERLNVDCETVPVPGRTEGRDPDANRSVLDYLRYLPRVRRTIDDDHDVVHANYGLTAPAALAQCRRPRVLSLWGSDVFGRYGWLSKLCAPLFDAVVVMSEEMAAELPCDATVIPHGVDLDQFRPLPRDEALASLGWDPNANHVLFPAPTARPEKDFARAKRIFEAAQDRLGDRTVLHTPDGRLPHDAMPLAMNAADAMLLTSRHEGSPNVVKEAMACNLPVVSTPVGDVPERLATVTPSAVADTDEALTDALVTILASGQRSDGRSAATDVSVAATADQYRRVYDRVRRDES